MLPKTIGSNALIAESPLLTQTDNFNYPGEAFMGKDNSESQRVCLTKKDRENHTHIIGSTGTGKSKFMELLIRNDIKNNKAGFCLIDPHGSLYDEVVNYAIKHYPRLAGRFILFNPAGETEQIIGFNPAPHSEHFAYTLYMLVKACLKAWGQDDSKDTPRISRWLVNIFYPILINKLTLLETTAMMDFHKSGYRKTLLIKVNNPNILGDWESFDKSSHSKKLDLMEGASNRLRAFLDDPLIRNIIGQREKVLDFHKIMNEGKILLVNLSSGGKLNPENAQLLGTMLINEIFRASKLRNPNNPKLKSFYLYIDEFAQFVTKDIARGLEECRKFKLFFILAHQHLFQLKKEDEYLYASVITNCKNKVVFGGLSQEDAKIMVNEVATGYLNLKKIKDEIYTTKERKIIEMVDIVSNSESASKTESHSQAKGKTYSLGKTKGSSDTTTHGQAHQLGQAQAHGGGESSSRGESMGRGESQGGNYSETHGLTQGETKTVTDGETENSFSSDTSGQSDGRTEQSSFGSGDGKGVNYSPGRTVSGRNDQQNHFHSTANSRQINRQKSNTKVLMNLLLRGKTGELLKIKPMTKANNYPKPGKIQ